MSEIKDNFIKSMDFSQCGITHYMDSLMEMVRVNDLQLHTALTERGIKPQVSAIINICHPKQNWGTDVIILYD